MTNNDIIAGSVLQAVGKETVLNLAATVYTPAIPSTMPKILENKPVFSIAMVFHKLYDTVS